MTLDFRPVRGKFRHGRMYYSGGCNGHGIAQCTLMGTAIADEILGEPSEELAVLDRFVPPLPPEPIRYLAVWAIRSYLARVDRKVDRAIVAEARVDRV